jgi:hypothetical protein
MKFEYLVFGIKKEEAEESMVRYISTYNHPCIYSHLFDSLSEAEKFAREDKYSPGTVIRIYRLISTGKVTQEVLWEQQG